jgi:hypothetical protein
MASLNQPGHYGQRRARRGRLGGRGTNPVSFCMNLVVAGQLGSWARAGRRVGPGRDVHGPALGHVIGDRIPESSIAEMLAYSLDEAPPGGRMSTHSSPGLPTT